MKLRTFKSWLGLASFVYLLYNCQPAKAMSCPIALAQLKEKQASIQKGKEQGRTLKEYDDYIFTPNQKKYSRASKSGVGNFLKKLIHSAGFTPENPSLHDLLKSLVQLRGRTVHWVDLGGGLGIPMREVARLDKEAMTYLDFKNIDLFDWEKTPNQQEIFSRLKQVVSPDIFNPKFRPNFIEGNVETSKVNIKPDLVTSIESIQYINGKLKLIVNWYNQLADQGMIIIATEHEWPEWIRNEGIKNQSTIFKDFIRILREAGIEIAVTKYREHDPDDSATALLIVKKPGTTLNLATNVTELWVNPYDYTASYYLNLPADRSPVYVLPQTPR